MDQAYTPDRSTARSTQTNTGLTYIREAEVTHDTLSNPKPHYKYKQKELTKPSNNPQESVAKIFALCFGAKKAIDIFGCDFKDACAFVFGSVELKFASKELADKALATFEVYNARRSEVNRIQAIQTTYDGQNSITIPGPDVKKFFVEMLSFDEKFYNKAIRDVAALQRAQQEGTLDGFKAKASGKLGEDEVRSNTKEWVKSGPCKIEKGNAICLEEVVEKFKKNCPDYKTESIIPGFKNEIMEEFPKWAPDQTGFAYSPEKGWLTPNQLAISVAHSFYGSGTDQNLNKNFSGWRKNNCLSQVNNKVRELFTSALARPDAALPAPTTTPTAAPPARPQTSWADNPNIRPAAPVKPLEGRVSKQVNPREQGKS